MACRNGRNSDVSDDDMETDAAVDAGIDSDEEGGLRIDEEIYIPPPFKRTDLDAGAPRLMIDTIVNENFKSYADKVIIGPFDECFSAVIGPNGSGKSNVIDSMLFVFGYRSSKIRSKKISSLIHNSSQRTGIGSCCVSIHFRRIINKADGTFETIPNSEVVISRTAFKDNSSFYKLNGRKVQLKEIAKLLKSEGIDLDHNRFLILQGEVEQIAMMKPKGQNENDTGMLEFLEDIIGTSRYKEPIEKLSQKVELLTEQRAEKLNRLRVVEAEKNALEEPMQDAVRYLRMENAITKCQHQLYHCKRSETSAEIVKQEARKIELDKDYADLVAEMKRIHEEKDTKNRAFRTKCKHRDSLQKEKVSLTTKFADIRKCDEALHAELVETNKRRKENIAALKTETATLAELEKVSEESARKIKECEELAEKTQVLRDKEESALKELMNGLMVKIEPLMKDRKELETKLIALRQDVDQAKATYDLAETELNIYTSIEQTEKDKLAEIRETLEKTSDTLKQRKEQMLSLNAKIPATTKSLKKAQSELNDVLAREAEMSSRLKNKRLQFEEHRSSMVASQSRNRVIDALMQEKRAGRIPGLFGRMGDLGAIDAKYDVAISTACGALDNVVVDTVETAERCIVFLRQNDIGRTSFVPLDKQARFLTQCTQRIQTPENVPRLFDLVKVQDERVLPAFYFALRDTLVANDLDQATRIAYGARRHRVVTLKGELIDVSGTMSGGGRTVLRGRMGQRVVGNEATEADIEKLQAELDEVYEKCNHLRLRQQPLEEQVYTLSTALKDMTLERGKFEIDLKALTVQEPSLRDQLEAQEKKAAQAVSDPRRIKKLTKALEKARDELERMKERSRETEVAVARLSQEIDEISDGRVKEQQKKINSLIESIDKPKAEIVRLIVAVKTTERAKKRAETRMQTLKNDVESCEQFIRDKQRQKVEFEKEAEIVRKRLDELNDALMEREELADGLKEEIAGLTSRETELKALKIDLDQKIGESEIELNALKKMIPEYTRRIAGLKLQEVPGEPPETLKDLTDDEVEALNGKKVAAQLQKAKNRLPTKVPNMQVIEDFSVKEDAYRRRTADLQEITDARNKLRDIHDTARKRRADEFLEGFTVMTSKLKEMYRMITIDGDAELELVDSIDPFSEGVIFTVRPPKKSWKNITNLSGGEKTLSSLALVFALHHYKPSPVYFMDEIDAALDFKNVSIIAHFIKERAKNSQFIVVSLRENMYELANTLVGIYKTYDATKTAVLDLRGHMKAFGQPAAQSSQQTVKNRYGSQHPKTMTQPLPREVETAGGSGRAEQQMAATCPAAMEDSAPLASTSAANVSLELGDLCLPPTPNKTPTSRYSSSSDTVDGTAEKRSTLKKRRL